MALPTTESGYAFSEEEEVSVGDPTEAEAHYNTLAENTDWLNEAKMFGWNGSSATPEGQLHSDKTATGSIWVAQVSEADGSSTSPVKLCHVSAVGIPLADDGFKQRLLLLNFVVVATNSSYLSDKSIEGFLPGGDKDKYLGGDSEEPISNETEGGNWARSTGSASSNALSIQMEPLYAGPGQNDFDDDEYFRKFVWEDALSTNDIQLYFWVDDSSGDLMFQFTGLSDSAVAIHGAVFYGPVWG